MGKKNQGVFRKRTLHQYRPGGSIFPWFPKWAVSSRRRRRRRELWAIKMALEGGDRSPDLPRIPAEAERREL